jgi:streptogramin lyase
MDRAATIVERGGVTVEADGSLLLTNNPNAAAAGLVRFDPVGQAETVVSSGGALVSAFGVAVEARGTIVVADQVNGILRVDPATGAQSTLSSGGDFAFPFAVAIVR